MNPSGRAWLQVDRVLVEDKTQTGSATTTTAVAPPPTAGADTTTTAGADTTTTPPTAPRSVQATTVVAADKKKKKGRKAVLTAAEREQEFNARQRKRKEAEAATAAAALEAKKHAHDAARAKMTDEQRRQADAAALAAEQAKAEAHLADVQQTHVLHRASKQQQASTTNNKAHQQQRRQKTNKAMPLLHFQLAYDQSERPDAKEGKQQQPSSSGRERKRPYNNQSTTGVLPAPSPWLGANQTIATSVSPTPVLVLKRLAVHCGMDVLGQLLQPFGKVGPQPDPSMWHGACRSRSISWIPCGTSALPGCNSRQGWVLWALGLG